MAERELEDDYPIYYGYLYIADNKVWRRHEESTAKEVKDREKFKSFKNCDLEARNLWHLMV